MIMTTLRGKKFIFETKPGLFSKDEIDPGSRLLIETMIISPDAVVLDLGCGYGVIGLTAAALAPKGKIYMVDTDIRAIKYSKINAKLNKINNVEIITSDGFENLPDIKFDLIVSNPPSHLPKEVLLEFIEGAKTRLKTNGNLYFVNEKRLKPLIRREFERVFDNYEIALQTQRYIVSIARNNLGG